MVLRGIKWTCRHVLHWAVLCFVLVENVTNVTKHSKCDGSVAGKSHQLSIMFSMLTMKSHSCCNPLKNIKSWNHPKLMKDPKRLSVIEREDSAAFNWFSRSWFFFWRSTITAFKKSIFWNKEELANKNSKLFCQTHQRKIHSKSAFNALFNNNNPSVLLFEQLFTCDSAKSFSDLSFSMSEAAS